MLTKFLSTIIATATAFSYAYAETTVYPKNIDVTIQEALTPGQYRVETSAGVMNVEITGIEKKQLHKPCDAADKSEDIIHHLACKVVDKLFVGESGSVVVEEYNFQNNIAYGRVLVNGKLISHELIERGLVRQNLSERNNHLSRLEAIARCKRLGIWEGLLGNNWADLECQET